MNERMFSHGILLSTPKNALDRSTYVCNIYIYTQIAIEGSLEVKLPTVWRSEKQSRAEAERRGRLEERRSEEKE